MSISVQELEKIRLNFKLRRKINKITFFLIPVISIPIVVYAEYIGFGDNSYTISFLAIIIMIFNFIRNIAVWAYTSIKFEKLFKEGILEDLVQSLLPNIHYKSNSHISKDTFLESHLFKQKARTSLAGSDLFSGNFGDMNYEISLLSYRKLSTEHIIRSKGSMKSEAPLFTGIFMFATLKQFIKEPVYILPMIRSSNKAISTLMDKMNLNQLPEAEEIPLNELGIEGKFTVLSNDAIAAKRMLNPAIIEEIIRLNKLHPYKIFISYIGNKVYCAIDKVYNFFDVSINRSILDTESSKGLFKDLNDSLRILKALAAVSKIDKPVVNQ